MKRLVVALVMCSLLFFSERTTHADVIFFTNSSSSVLSPNLTANFDSLVSSSADVRTYSEGGLSITSDSNNGNKVRFDAFGEGNRLRTGFFSVSGGTDNFTSISAINGSEISELEFRFGGGFTTSPKLDLLWETRRGGVVTGTGIEFDLDRNIFVGWNDTERFDELRVAASDNFDAFSKFGDPEQIALDDLNVVTAVPEPSSIFLTLIGLGSVLVVKRRRKHQTDEKTN